MLLLAPEDLKATKTLRHARVLVTKQPTRHIRDSDDDMIQGDGFREAVK
jgi:hypothetical protein